MKKIFLITFCALIFNVSAFSQSKMTIRDYFLAVPTEYLKADTAKRAAWIDSESNEDQNLTYTIPITEVTDETTEGSVFGGLQVFEKNDGGILLGMVTNVCAEDQCRGMLLFLEYKGGKFTDVSEDYIINPDNDEIIRILREAPAFEDKKSLEEGKQVSLAIEFYGGNKVINFVAGCKKDCDGGVVAKMFKWNGEAFEEFASQESPE